MSGVKFPSVYQPSVAEAKNPADIVKTTVRIIVRSGVYMRSSPAISIIHYELHIAFGAGDTRIIHGAYAKPVHALVHGPLEG